MTFAEGQIFTIGTDGSRIAIRAIQEKKGRSVPQVDQNFIFPNSSPERAETRATRADWGKGASARHTDSGSWYLPSLRASMLPLLPLLYLGHLIRCQIPDRFRVKGRKLAAEAVSKKTGVHPEGQNGPLATFPSNPEGSCWAAQWREQTFRTKPWSRRPWRGTQLSAPDCLINQPPSPLCDGSCHLKNHIIASWCPQVTEGDSQAWQRFESGSSALTVSLSWSCDDVTESSLEISQMGPGPLKGLTPKSWSLKSPSSHKENSA